MPYPAGIETREISFSSAFLLVDGDVIDAEVTVTPNKKLVWAATSQSGLPGVEKINLNPSGSITLPATNQDGWLNENGQVLDTESGTKHTHYYTIKIKFTVGGGTTYRGDTITKNVLVPVGSGAISFESMTPVGHLSGARVLSVPLMYVEALEAAESAEMAAAEASAAAAAASVVADSRLEKSQNLADLSDKEVARTNLEVSSTTEMTADIAAAVADLVGGAPDALNTLNKLAASLNDDAAFSSTVTNALAARLESANNLSDVANVETARANLDVLSTAESDATFGAAAILDPETAVGAALNSTFAPIERGVRLGVIGDSIATYASSGTAAFSRTGPLLAGDRLREMRLAGAGGATTEVARTTHLPDLLAWDATHVLMATGTNDMNGTVANAIAAMLLMEADVLGAGAQPIMWTPPPRRGDAGTNTKTAQYATWVKSYAAQRGYRVLDAHTILADPLTGELPESLSLSGDTIHPNDAGHHLLGHAFGALLRDMFPPIDYLIGSPLDPSLTASWGLFLNDSNSDGRADGVGGYGTHPTMSLVDGAPHGKWQEISGLAGVSVPGGALRVDVTGVVPGNLYEFAAVLEADSTGKEDSGSGFGYYLEWRSSSAFVSPFGPYGSNSGSGASFGMEPEGAIAGERMCARGLAVAPAGADRLRIDMTRFAGTPTKDWYIRYGCVTLRDLTALGLT